MTSPSDDILDLLAAYALGALDPEEIARVGALLDERPELRTTLAELRATADKLPYALPEAAPPANLRQRALDRALGRAAPRRQPAPVRPARGWILALGGLTAVAVLAAVLGWAQLATVRSEMSGAQAQLATTQRQLGEMQTQIADAQRQLSRMQAQIADAQNVLASLHGQAGSAAILQTRGGASVLVAQLPPLRPGRVYQLWRIPAAGAPISAGLFTVDPQGYGQADLAPGQQPRSGETIAVTDEPQGGSAGPTTQPIVVGQSGGA